MREIEGIDEVVAKLKPHFATITEHFEHENRIFVGLIASPHDTLGRILKCHIVVEHYLDRFLSKHFKINDFGNLRFSFAQKATLLPNEGSAAAFVKPGVFQLNRIRNRFAHSLGAELSAEELKPIHPVLGIARPGVAFESPVEAIEAFTTVACTFLIVAPPELQQILAEAFSSVRLSADSPD